MSVLAPFCFVLAGIALWLLRDENSAPAARTVGRVCASLIVLGALLSLVDVLSGADLTARVALRPASMVGHLLIGLALAGMDWKTPRGHRPAILLSYPAALIGLLALIGFAYDATEFYTIHDVLLVTAPTALLLLVAAAGILCARPQERPFNTLVEDGPGSAMARLLLPLIVAVPLLIGWLCLRGQRLGWYGLEFGMAVFSISNVFILGALTWILATRLNQTDAERGRVGAGLKDELERQRILFKSAPDGMMVMNASQDVVEANLSFARMIGRAPEEILHLHPWDWDVVLSTRAKMKEMLPELPTTAGLFETRFRGRGGAILDIELSYCPLLLGGEPHVLCVCRDISQRVKAVAALREQAVRLRSLSRRMIEVEEDERRRISHELHDRIGQNLSALGIRVAIARFQLADDSKAVAGSHLDAAQELLQATTAQVRNVMSELRPAALDEYGLFAALRVHVDALVPGPDIVVTLDGAELLPRLPPVVELALFRVAQEAIANAIKHARAQHIEIHLAANAASAILAITDDGVGFDMDSGIRRQSWGMSIMRERAEAIDAHLHVESVPGRGTRVKVDVSRQTA